MDSSILDEYAGVRELSFVQFKINQHQMMDKKALFKLPELTPSQLVSSDVLETPAMDIESSTAKKRLL